MSFKNKLILFFLAIVILPMSVSAILIIKTSGEIGNIQSETSLEEVRGFAAKIYRNEQEALLKQVEKISDSKEFRKKWGAKKDLKNYLRKEIGSDVSVIAYLKNRRVAWKLGEGRGIGSVRIAGPGSISYIDFYGMSPDRFTKKLESLTAAGFEIRNSSKKIASAGESEGILRNYKTGSIEISIYGGERARERWQLIIFVEKSKSDISSRPVLIVIFITLLLLAIAVALLLQKSMRGQLADMAEAAASISSGNFDVEVSSGGSDELSALAGEINKMNRQIKNQIKALKNQSRQLERVFDLLGETMSSTLDQEKIIDIIAEVSLELSQSDLVVLEYMDGTKKIKGNDNYLWAIKKIPYATSFKLKSVPINNLHVVQAAVKKQGSLDSRVATIFLARKREYSKAELEVINSIALSASLSLNNISLHEKITHMATTDSVTGIFNRAKFNTDLENEIKRSRRFQNQLALIIIDIDDFKKINDNYGHLDGDEALRQVAEIIKKNTRDVDTKARFGGEEFAIILPETDTDGAFLVAERIRQDIDSFHFKNRIKITISAGVGQLQKNDDFDEFIKRIDQALYRAKKAGKNRVEKEY